MMVKIYCFSVENTVITVSNAINHSKTGSVARFDKIVNPGLRNGVCRNGIEGLCAL